MLPLDHDHITLTPAPDDEALTSPPSSAMETQLRTHNIVVTRQLIAYYPVYGLVVGLALLSPLLTSTQVLVLGVGLTPVSLVCRRLLMGTLRQASPGRLAMTMIWASLWGSSIASGAGLIMCLVTCVLACLGALLWYTGPWTHN